MRGTVKQGSGGAGGGVKEEGGGVVKTTSGGGRRSKANNTHAAQIPTATIKQEVGAEVKPDPDAATATTPCLNGDDPVSKTASTCPGNNNNNTNAINNNKAGTTAKVKTEIANGGPEGDIKPITTSTTTATTTVTTTTTTTTSTTTTTTPPHTSEGCNVIGDGDGAKVAGVCAGVGSLDGVSLPQLHTAGRISCIPCIVST